MISGLYELRLLLHLLTGLIRDREYENGWHKTSEGSSPVVKPTVIRMKKSDEGTTRKSFIIDEDVAAEWKEFNKNAVILG